MKRICLLAVLVTCCGMPVSAETLEQVISREHPHFDNNRAILSVGEDGMVYLSNSAGGTGYALRMRRDGSERRGGSIIYSVTNTTANRDGIIATANSHFAHKVALYDPAFVRFAEVSDFLVNDQVGWDAPSHVEAGESGDFYGSDKHRDRILRISPQGRLLTSYPIPREPEGHPGLIEDFRVSEKDETFYVLARNGDLRAVGFDGKTKWTLRHPGLGWSSGGFDVARDGTLFLIGAYENKVQRFSPEGKPVGEVPLAMGDLQPRPGTPGLRTLQVFENEVLLRRLHPTELFQRYSLDSGERLSVATIDHERLVVSYPESIWTAGERVPFSITFDSGARDVAPAWRVWLRSINDLDYRELIVRDGHVQVPQDLGGVSLLKVSPEVEPWERGKASEYLVRGWIEIRQPDHQGSLNVWTQNGRNYFARGEEISVSLLARRKDSTPVEVTVQLVERRGRTAARGSMVVDGVPSEDPQEPSAPAPLLSVQVTLTPGKPQPITFPGRLTRALRPGEYRILAKAPELTSIAQTIVIGPGGGDLSFLRMRHGDYGPTYPSASLSNAADVVAAHLARERKLGFNFFVDRIGSPLQQGALQWDGPSQAQLRELTKKLADDPLAAAPETVQLASPLLQTMGAYSAYGLKQMAILFLMDAGLPLGGLGHDPRKPEQLAADVRKVTEALLPFSSFRGWSWHSNWWIYQQRGANAATSAEEKAAYEAALTKAKQTGEWSEVLDRVSERRLGFAVEAQEFLRKSLDAVEKTGHLKTASAGTYRNVEAYPPVSLQNVDEVDLHGQFEQIFLPYFPPHAVDFYRRPGKPVWGHPEVWNDAGTGEQVLPELFSMLMRAPNGVGTSGNLPAWTGKTGIMEDPRLSQFGTLSIYRALNSILERYGAWISTLETDDQIAIVGLPRQFKIDEWGQVMGRHFARVMEAYVACLHAHHPPQFVFVDDMTPDSLKHFKAVLLVDQWVEMEPMLKTALQQAQAAGVTIFYDGTCREELVRDFTPLGIAFDLFEKDSHPASDDGAYYRFPQYVHQHLPTLKKALDDVARPAARIENSEVWASQLKSEEGRYLFVVNNTSVPLDPSRMWRTTLHVASLLPVTERVGFTIPAPSVYDVFAMRQVTLRDGAVVADLRDLPARLYAVLPSPISRVELRGPAEITAGQSFAWSAQVHDAEGKPIAASIPLRVRLVTEGGDVLEEQFVSASSRGAKGEFTMPVNGVSKPQFLEATELFSGRSARLEISTKGSTSPLPPDLAESRAEALPVTTRGQAVKLAVEPSEQRFGPHLRDLIVTGDGKTAVLNAMNWNENLYAVDADTGKLLWRKKVGNYFTFAPQHLESGLAVQGFDYSTPEGYHLYLLNNRGDAEQRFSLYGLPRRLPHRFVPGLLGDRERPINNFAAAADGRWVASAGDLGLAVWDRSGRLLWKQEGWRNSGRTARLAAVADTLLVASGMEIQAHNAQSGETLWQIQLAPSGEVRKLAVSRDGSTVAVLSSAGGGQVDLLREGRRIGTFITGGEDLALSRDGSRFVVTDQNLLKYFTQEQGFRWSFAADDRVRNPRLSADGERIAAASELGTVYVLDSGGRLLYERDHETLVVPAWMPEGDLLLATWMGRVIRLDARFQEKWNVRLQPVTADPRDSLLAQSNVPTARITDWGNSLREPLPLSPNLLTEVKSMIHFAVERAPHVRFERPADSLTDGSPEPPEEPWLHWGDINRFAEGNPVTAIVLDTFRTQLRVEAITLVEDPDHPESWLRDALLDVWDPRQERWVHVQPLLSDSAVHTHRLPTAAEGARFRIVLPRGFVSNLRLAEIVLHGEVLGSSHPDVIARKPLAELFDDSEEFKEIYPYPDRWKFQLEGASSGGRFLQVNANQVIAPRFYPIFGHTVPNWDFRIVENPREGEYRYLQWDWKALSPETKGATLELHGEGPSIRFAAGEPTGTQHIPAQRIGETVPSEWRTVRIDLWEALKKPQQLRSLYFSAASGAVGFDRVVLGRTLSDLPPEKK